MTIGEKHPFPRVLALTYRVMRDVKVVPEKSNQAEDDQQHVALYQSVLNKADRIAEEPNDARAKPHGAVHNPCVPPHRNFGDETREPASAVHAHAVDHVAVEGAQS